MLTFFKIIILLNWAKADLPQSEDPTIEINSPNPYLIIH